jgi:hypothetical protein
VRGRRGSEEHVEAKDWRGRRAMDADGERLPWPAGLGVRPGRRHRRGAQQGGAASPGVHREPLPKEGIAGPPNAYAGMCVFFYLSLVNMYKFKLHTW